MGAIETTFSYADAGDLSYDTTLVETAGGVTKLKAFPLDLAALYDTPGDPDADYSIGPATGTLVNGATVAGGFLNCTGGVAGRHCLYDAANAANAATQGTLKFLWKPDYNGYPATNTSLFYMTGSPVGKNQVNIDHFTNGQLRIEIWSQTGVAIIDTAQGPFSAVQGQVYEVTLCWDVTTGATRLFVDGTQFGATRTATGNRSGSITSFRVGGGLATSLSYAEIDEFTLYNQSLFLADYTPLTSPILYTRSDPAVATTGSVLASAVSAFTAVTTESAPNTVVGYQLEINGTKKWWDGFAWSDSDGTYAESNTAAEVSTNASSLSLPALGAQVKPIVVLRSVDGLATPDITSVTLTYQLVVEEPTAPRECLVYGFLQDIGGDNIPGVTVYAEADFGFTHGAHVQRSGEDGRETTTTDSEGRWQLYMVETETIALYPYRIVVDPGDGDADVYTGLQVPDAVTCPFADLTTRTDVHC